MKTNPINFLPVNRDDMTERGWEELDIIIVSGDAYVDHPAWAAAILGRFLEHKGYRVGIIAQPGWHDLSDIRSLGQPRLFFAISGGNMDSLINHYTADKKKRREDMYSPGGQSGMRPNRATIVYSNLVRQAFPGVPVVIGGVEASLRRLAHYDYWSDQVRRSILVDSKADLLVYGMGEFPLLEIANRLKAGQDIEYIRNLRSTCYLAKNIPPDSVELPSFEDTAADKRAFARAAWLMQGEINPYCARTLVQKHGGRWVVQNPPSLPLAPELMDEIYELPFLRQYHPQYKKLGGIPGLEPVRFSIVTHRGCFGGCSFCSLGMHQGKFIQNRSPDSIAREASRLAGHPDFKGTIPDVGAPSANMYGLKGMKGDLCRNCRRSSCLFPGVCKNLDTDHTPSVKLWERLRRIKAIRHIFVASGIRYDLVLRDKSKRYLHDLCRYHVGGQLKIAPEHISRRVTRLMHKPGKSEYINFINQFKQMNVKMGKDQYLIPYFISAHPGSELLDTVELAEFVRDQLQYYPEQVQNFTPTPMTISTCMYYTGLDPESGKAVYVPRQDKERRMQRALLQYRNRSNQNLARAALIACEREDLIGSGSKALVRGNAKAAAGLPNKRNGQNRKRK
ncbi:MAG: YgiQ family radical SAM protein [Syntrophomonadaceae bacterium]|nr:YgiQ family radical SAM protein [Syntrophomonadaceae bacterium]